MSIREDSSVKQNIETVTSWPQITTSDGQFNAATSEIEDREIGYLHLREPVEIGYPQPLQDQLIVDGRTGEHHVVPHSNATIDDHA